MLPKTFRNETVAKPPLAVSYISIYDFKTYGYAPGKIESVHLHQYIGGINCYAFKDMKNLREILVDKKNPIFESEDGVLYGKHKSILKHYPAQKEDAVYRMPGTVSHIEKNAFEYNEHLKKIYISPNVEELPSFAFLNCKNLKEVYLPDSVKKISLSTFTGCPDVKIIYSGKLLKHGVVKDTKFSGNTYLEAMNELERTLIEKNLSVILRNVKIASCEPGKIVPEIEPHDTNSLPLTPFVRIEKEPPILIGKMLNGVYYKANIIERPFICTVREAYQILCKAKKENIPIAYYKNGLQELLDDYKAEQAEMQINKAKKTAKQEDLEK